MSRLPWAATFPAKVVNSCPKLFLLTSVPYIISQDGLASRAGCMTLRFGYLGEHESCIWQGHHLDHQLG